MLNAVSKNIRCSKCKGNNIIKKGKRKTKFGVEQIYYCKDCRKIFVQRWFKNKTYNAKVIVETINLYHLGFTLDETAKTINKRFKVHVTKSSIHRWIKEYYSICTYHNLRNAMMKQYGNDIIVSKDFEYNGLAYNFKYHKGKLACLGKSFPDLVSYLKRFESGCPDFFDSIEKRCSKMQINVNIEKTEGNNPNSRLASLALSSCLARNERHSVIERFMLINDDATIAVEVPIWLWEKNLDLSIAGHIDLIQIKDNLVYIVDYKPDAAREKDERVASQLFLYASGLSFRTSIPFDNIRCAWFDDRNYFEFEPKKAKVKYTTTLSLKKD
jgi:transposase-like protein